MGEEHRVRVYENRVLGGDIWCVRVGEEHRFMVYENRVLRVIFGVSQWEKNIG